MRCRVTSSPTCVFRHCIKAEHWITAQKGVNTTMQRKRSGITSASPCIRSIQTEGRHQDSERKHIVRYSFYTQGAQSMHSRWKKLRVTFDENLHRWRQILSANFKRVREQKTCSWFPVSKNIQADVTAATVLSGTQSGDTFRGHSHCKMNWHSGQKKHANSPNQRQYSSPGKSPPASQTAVLFLGWLQLFT